MAKAARTFLQHELFPNLSGLGNLGKHHVPPALRDAGRAVARRISADWKPTEVGDLFRAAAAEAVARGERPVLSDEDFSVYKFIDPETIARRLYDIFGSYDVLLILREPVSWLRSNYLFHLSNHNPVAALGFDDWLTTHMTGRNPGSAVSNPGPNIAS